MFYDRKKYLLYHNGFEFETLEPDGWKDDNKRFERNETYHGIAVTLTTGLTFFGETRDWFMSVLKTAGPNADIRLIKNVRDPNTDIWKKDYEAWADLRSYKITETGFECDFNADPLTTLFKSKNGSTVELERKTNLKGEDIGPLPTNTLYLQSRQILLTSKLAQNPGGARMIMSLPNGGGACVQNLDIAELSEDLDSGVENVYTQQPGVYRTNITEGSVAEGFLGENTTGSPITYRIDLNVRHTFKMWTYNGVSANITFKIRIDIYDGVDGILNRSEDCYSWIGGSDDFPEKISFEKYIPSFILGVGQTATLMYYLESDERVELWWWEFNYWGIESPPDPTKYYIEIGLTVQQDTISVDSDAQALMIYEYVKRLNEIVLGASFKSDLLARPDIDNYSDYGDFSKIALTHGMWVRGLVNGTPKYKPISTSLKDCLAAINVAYPIGVSLIDGVFRLEHREFFYRKVVTIQLGEVKDLIIEPDEKSYNSTITVGYQKAGGYDEDQGLDEYNRETEYGTILNKTEQELKLISKYRADSYGLETIRRDNPLVTPIVDVDKDSKFDDHIWMLDVNKPDGQTSWQLSGWSERFAVQPTGVYSPETAWNLWLSPINILLRHGSWIKPSLYLYPESYISFNYSEGNSELTTQLIGGNTYSQNIGIPVADLDSSANKGMTAKFQAPVTWEQLNGTTNGIKNIYGMIEFWRHGVRYRAFVMGVTLKNEIGEFNVKLFS